MTKPREGVVMGLLGVLCFSLTLPATRVAVPELGGTFVGLGRAVVAGILAALLLKVMQQPLPARQYWIRLGIVAVGVVIGFPLFSALALKTLPAAHGSVLTGLLPAATAIMAVIRVGERPPKAFWLACGAGVVAVIAFAVAEGAGMPQFGDLLLLIAVILAALGYAEGASLAKELGSWQVICWALVFSAPFLIVPVMLAVPTAIPSLQAGLGFVYVSVFSMFLGFFAWYRGLSLGGIARIGQLQLLQPVLTLVWSGLLLHEAIKPLTIVAALAVIGSVALTQRIRQPSTQPSPP